jgi:biotin carboxyl carrier protein
VAKHEVKAEVGGSVWTHAVGVGQRVVAGTSLLICECMKTEFPIVAPVDGVVTWLRPCGETIEADDVVATLDA